MTSQSGESTQAQPQERYTFNELQPLMHSQENAWRDMDHEDAQAMLSAFAMMGAAAARRQDPDEYWQWAERSVAFAISTGRTPSIDGRHSQTFVSHHAHGAVFGIREGIEMTKYHLERDPYMLQDLCAVFAQYQHPAGEWIEAFGKDPRHIAISHGQEYGYRLKQHAQGIQKYAPRDLVTDGFSQAIDSIRNNDLEEHATLYLAAHALEATEAEGKEELAQSIIRAATNLRDRRKTCIEDYSAVALCASIVSADPAVSVETRKAFADLVATSLHDSHGQDTLPTPRIAIDPPDQYVATLAGLFAQTCELSVSPGSREIIVRDTLRDVSRYATLRAIHNMQAGLASTLIQSITDMPTWLEALQTYDDYFGNIGNLQPGLMENSIMPERLRHFNVVHGISGAVATSHIRGHGDEALAYARAALLELVNHSDSTDGLPEGDAQKIVQDNFVVNSLRRIHRLKPDVGRELSSQLLRRVAETGFNNALLERLFAVRVAQGIQGARQEYARYLDTSAAVQDRSLAKRLQAFTRYRLAPYLDIEG